MTKPQTQINTAASAQDMITRIGKLTRMLRESLQQLGLEQAIVQAAEMIPDAHERLNYVINMTSQAAERTLNSVELAQPLQNAMGSSAKALQARWDAWFAHPVELVEARDLVADTRQFIAQVPEQTRETNAQLLSIMMAQDFQDLTGQVIKRMMNVVQEIERELVAVLLDNISGSQCEPTEPADPLLNGPQFNPNKSDVFSNQNQVDELLNSLGV